MIKSKTIVWTLSFVLFGVISTCAQNQLDEKLRRFAEVSLSSKWTIDIMGAHSIQYSFADSIDLCHTQDLSPLKHYCTDTLTLDTFNLVLQFDQGWDQQRMKKTKSENEAKIDIIRKRIIACGDSVNWKGFKTNKELAESHPLHYVRIVNDWTQEELSLIHSVEKLPFDIYKGYGVFLDKNADYITPEVKQHELEDLYLKLKGEGLKSFEVFVINEHPNFIRTEY